MRMLTYADVCFWRQKRFRVERAAFWFKKGAEIGHPESQVELATMLQQGHESKPGDDPRKVPHFTCFTDTKVQMLTLLRA